MNIFEAFDQALFGAGQPPQGQQPLPPQGQQVQPPQGQQPLPPQGQQVLPPQGQQVQPPQLDQYGNIIADDAAQQAQQEQPGQQIQDPEYLAWKREREAAKTAAAVPSIEIENDPLLSLLPEPQASSFMKNGVFDQAGYLDETQRVKNANAARAEARRLITTPLTIGGVSVIPVTSREELAGFKAVAERLSRSGATPMDMVILSTVGKLLAASNATKNRSPAPPTVRNPDGQSQQPQNRGNTANPNNSNMSLESFLNGEDLFSARAAIRR